jgi:hypothetical protein
MAVLVAGEHPSDDLEVVAEPGEPLTGLGKAIAVGEPFVALPAGADPELHPPAMMVSIVLIILAVSAGLRNAVQITVAEPDRFVSAASAASEVAART